MQYQHQLVSEHKEGFEVAVNRLEGEEREVHAALQDLARQPLGDVPVNLDLNFGVALAVGEDDPRQEVERGALVRADADAAPLQRAQLGNRLARLVAQGKNSLRVVVYDLARFGQRRRLLRAVEERRADLLFQTADGDADRWLRAPDAVSRLREAALLDDLQEEFELRHLHADP